MPSKTPLRQVGIPTLALALLALLLAGCFNNSDVAFRQRTCESAGCHVGIEQMHPLFALSCVDCHGGDDRKLAKSSAHVARPLDFGEFPKPAGSKPEPGTLERGPTLAHDVSDPAILAYRRFLNPGDLHVAQDSCGSGAGTNCHQAVVDRVKRSTHATSAGLVSGTLFANGFRDRFTGDADGSENDKRAFMASYLPPTDRPLVALPGATPDPDGGTVPEISLAVPFDSLSGRDASVDPIDGEFMKNMVVSFLNTDCMRCHLWTEGVKRFGAYRSSGCSACHVFYRNEGRSQSMDATIPEDEIDHPFKHEMQRFPPDEQCIHCHNRGGRHGLEFVGIRERPQGFKDAIFNDHGDNDDRVNDSAGAGGRSGGFFPTLGRFFLARSAADALIPPEDGDSLNGREWLESKIFGRDTGRTDGNNYLIRDEDRENTIDETPPDIHFVRGMGCVDCHTEGELHGHEGRIYSDRFHELEIECESCHGTADTPATLVTRKGNPLPFLSRKASTGEVFQVLNLTGEKRRVLQVEDIVDPTHDDFNPNAALGCALHVEDANSGVALADRNRLECFTCHSTWGMQCLSCHMILDNGATNTSYLDNVTRAGKQNQQRFLTVHDQLILGFNQRDRISPLAVGGQAALFAISQTGAQSGGTFDENNFVDDPALPGRTVARFGFTTVDKGLHLPSMPFNQIFAHTTQAVPRNCDSCHPKTPAAGGSSDQEKELLDKAIGIGNGLRRSAGVPADRISTARVFDDSSNMGSEVIFNPFDVGDPLETLELHQREIKIRRENVRIFTDGKSGSNGTALDVIDFQTGMKILNADETDINIDEFIELAVGLPDPGPGYTDIVDGDIVQKRPTSHIGSGPLDARAINKMLGTVVDPQARSSE